MTNLVLSLWFLSAAHGLVPQFGSEPWICSGTDGDFVIESWTAEWEQPSLDQLRAVYEEAIAAWIAGHPTQPLYAPNGIETPRLVLPAETNGTPAYGVVATPGGRLVTYVDHASSRYPAQADANKLAALAEDSAVIAALRALRVNCTNAIAAAKLITDAKTKKAATDTAQALNDIRKILLKAYKVQEAQ